MLPKRLNTLRKRKIVNVECRLYRKSWQLEHEKMRSFRLLMRAYQASRICWTVIRSITNKSHRPPLQWQLWPRWSRILANCSSRKGSTGSDLELATLTANSLRPIAALNELRSGQRRLNCNFRRLRGAEIVMHIGMEYKSENNNETIN
jgi:hypothetical protein